MTIFLLDIFKYIILHVGVLGYEIKLDKRSKILAIASVLVCMVVLFYIEVSKNELVYILMEMLIISAVLFDKSVFPKLGIGILTKMFIDIIDALFLGILLFLRREMDSSEWIYSSINLAATSMGLILIIIILICFGKKRNTIGNYIEAFKLTTLIYFFVGTSCTGILIGFAGMIAIDESIVYNLKALLVVGTSILGIIIMCSSIMLHVLLVQRKALKEEKLYNEQCVYQQSKQLELLHDKDESLRSFRHDYNSHFNVMQDLLSEKNYIELEKYLEDLHEYNDSINYISTNNFIADAIINQYCEQGKRNNIVIDSEGQFPGDMKISRTDLCSLLSNSIKNAYESTNKCNNNRIISIDITNYNGIVFLAISNPISQKINERNGFMETTKMDKRNHGIGQKNMIQVIERNNGTIEWECENGETMKLSMSFV